MRALESTAREATVVVARLDQLPSLRGLALDVGFARLPLRVERIKFLIEPLFRGLARVHRTAKSLIHGAAFPTCNLLSPKNLGPDHRAPVMARATSESDP